MTQRLDKGLSSLRGTDRAAGPLSRLIDLQRRSPLAPLLYRIDVFRVVAVCVEPQPATEARLLRELLLGGPSHVIEQPTVDFFLLLQHVGEGEASFLLCHQSVEGIDAAVFVTVSRRCATLKDERQVLQGFFLPRGDVGKDVLDGPVSRDARFQQLRVRQTGL